jgi:competence protein ComEC
MLKEKIFYFSISAFILGIFCATVFQNLNFYFFIFPTLIFIFLFFNPYFSKQYKTNLLFFLFPSLFFNIGSLYYIDFYHNKIPRYDAVVNSHITQIFVVDDEPEFKNRTQKLVVKDKNTDNRFLIRAPKIPTFEYGDEIQISGWLLKIKNFDTKFDYINFLKKNNIFYEIKTKKIVLLSKHKNSILKEKLFNFKKEILKKIKKLFPEPESALLAGILIGAKEDMDKKLLEDFRKTGIIHIVVLSGYNLSILAEFLMLILAFFGSRFSTLFGSLSIILFAIMTGASATVLRAATMALLIILAKKMGRDTEALRLLFLAAFIILIYNPMLLVFDPSFQLSFLATLGLLILAPKIEEKIKYGNFKIFNFKEILSATIAAQIFVSPLILYLMDTVSLVAILVNLLIIFLIPLTMFLGILNLIISIFSFNFALVFSYMTYLILKYDI